MPTTLTCPRCDSPAPSTERLCPACGHDLRTPVMELLDPPAGEPWARRWIREVPPVVPLVASVVALVLAGGALAFTLLRPDPTTCGRSLWGRPVAAQAAAAGEGWRLENLEPHDLGWTGYVTRGDIDSPSGAFVQVYCSGEPERLLEVVRDASRNGVTVDFRVFGDETFATRVSDGQSVQVWWRSGPVIARLTFFSPELEMAEQESMAAFVYETVR